MKRVFFIDLENLRKSILDDISTLTKDDKVVIFHNAIIKEEMPRKYKEELRKYAGKVVVEELTCAGKNAMDMQLCTYMGYYLSKENIAGTKFYIVSKDRGYDDAIKIGTKLILKETNSATLERVDNFRAVSEDSKTKEILKEMLVGYSKKVVSVTIAAFNTTSKLRTYQIHLQKNISKDADAVYNLTKKFYVEKHPC